MSRNPENSEYSLISEACSVSGRCNGIPGAMLKKDCVSDVHASCVYIYPPSAKFVDTWTQPHKSLPVCSLAVSSGLAVSSENWTHAVRRWSQPVIRCLTRAEALARWLQGGSHPCRTDGNPSDFAKLAGWWLDGFPVAAFSAFECPVSY